MSGNPVTRWALVDFGVGLGLGSAYIECSQKFGGYPTKFLPPKISNVPSQVGAIQTYKLFYIGFNLWNLLVVFSYSLLYLTLRLVLGAYWLLLYTCLRKQHQNVIF